MAVVERFKQEPMYGLSANKSGVGESSTVLLTALGDRDSEKNFLLRTSGRLLTDCTLFIAKGGGGARVFKNFTPPPPSKHRPLFEFPLAINNVNREWAKRLACEYSRFS